MQLGQPKACLPWQAVGMTGGRTVFMREVEGVWVGGGMAVTV